MRFVDECVTTAERQAMPDVIYELLEDVLPTGSSILFLNVKQTVLVNCLNAGLRICHPVLTGRVVGCILR